MLAANEAATNPHWLALRSPAAAAAAATTTQLESTGRETAPDSKAPTRASRLPPLRYIIERIKFHKSRGKFHFPPNNTRNYISAQAIFEISSA